MNFQDAVKICFSKYADFNGRASRPEYWYFALFIFLGAMIVHYVSPMIGALFSLGTMLPSIAAATRRLHDTNRSGWWQLLTLVPVIGWIVLIVFLAQEGAAE